MLRVVLSRAGAGVFLIWGAAIGCVGPAPDPPRAEFLVATSDSTFWVTSGKGGIHIRAVPMTIARYGGHFHEVYVADIDRSFSDAVFTGERVYVRDLEQNDSTLVYDDTAVVVMAARHAQTHPNARPLQPSDDTPPDPDVSAQGETDVLEIRGPYVLLEHRFAYDAVNGQQHDTVRTAVDLRDGRGATAAVIEHDAASADTSAVHSIPREWARQGYTLLARGGKEGSVSLTLRDQASRSWPLITMGSHPRIYWLDTPAADSTARRALIRAFNGAASYDETAKFAATGHSSSSHSAHSHSV